MKIFKKKKPSNHKDNLVAPTDQLTKMPKKQCKKGYLQLLNHINKKQLTVLNGK